MNRSDVCEWGGRDICSGRCDGSGSGIISEGKEREGEGGIQFSTRRLRMLISHHDVCG